jgi:hypothetical protein
MPKVIRLPDIRHWAVVPDDFVGNKGDYAPDDNDPYYWIADAEQVFHAAWAMLARTRGQAAQLLRDAIECFWNGE